METTLSAGDVGTGFGRPLGTHIKSLTEVGPGTPMGNLLRRYWHPVGLASHATETPREVRVLGEDLILFRDKTGRPELVHARCAHRGTTLYYGKVEERGIRCCYHGWLFDVEGRCLEQPCEPEGGRFRDRVRQPWYPVQELYGLAFAYMGPPEKKPVLPRYQCLEVLDAGEFIDADDSSIGSGGPQIVPCNWLQHFENVVDPYHVVVLHGTHSGPQFSEMMARMPDEVHFERTPLGVRASSTRRLADGTVMRGSAEVALPTLRVVPNPRAGVAGASLFGRVESIGWTLPMTTCIFVSTWRAASVRRGSCAGCARVRAASCGRSSRRKNISGFRATSRPRPARAPIRCIPRSILWKVTAPSPCCASSCASKWSWSPRDTTPLAWLSTNKRRP